MFEDSRIACIVQSGVTQGIQVELVPFVLNLISSRDIGSLCLKEVGVESAAS